MQRRYIRLLVVLLAAFLAFAAHLSGRMAAAQPVFSFAEAERAVFLTFDDGPSTVVTNSILDTLERENVKATFFVVGERIGGREETLKRIAGAGHTIGVHSESHRYGEIYASKEAFLEDALRCAEKIERVTGVKPCLYRFPGGGTHAEKAKLLESLGYKIVAWNAVCGDAEARDAAPCDLLETAVKTSEGKKRVVLLLHDGAFNKATAEALGDIIAHFREQGCKFCAF